MKNTIMIIGAVCTLSLIACGDEGLSDKTKATVEKAVDEVAEVVAPEKEPVVKVSPIYSMTYFQQRVVMSNFNWAECDKWVKASKASRLVDYTKARHEKCHRLFDDLNAFSEKSYGLSFTTAQWPSEDELVVLWADSEKAADACIDKNGFDACNLVLSTQIKDLSSIESIY